MSDCDCKNEVNPHCPNYTGCKVTSFTDFIVNQNIRKRYVDNYCEGDWRGCKRFITKKTLSFCPDFVLPDSPLSTEEIISKFDSEQTT